jgi:endoglucanase
MAAAGVAMVAVASCVLSGCSSPATTATSTTVPHPTDLAAAFLARYVNAEGRVVRYDQGGDTVSEGQAYALLLAVADHDRVHFASVWKWEREHLQQPDGLFAYHWANDQVASTTPATDADLDTAWALVLGAAAFHREDWSAAGLAVAAAVLANETVTAGGRLQLVAGPWARTAPFSVDPSYLAPEAMVTLAARSGDPRWAELATDSRQLVADLQGQGADRSLPPDWALLQPSGAIAASYPPSGGKPPSYGLDGQRVPIWYAADCAPSGRTLAAASWPVISGLPGHGDGIAYSLTGAVQDPATNATGLMAASASALAADQTARGLTLLAEGRALDHGANYYGDAWAALGTALLTTAALSDCPPAPAS